MQSSRLLSLRPPAGAAPSLLSSPGLELAITATVRDEGPYLEEWIAYHHALGVQHLFLYDNESADDTRARLRRFQAHGLVTVIDWPGRGRQLDAYLHALRLFGPSCRWMAFIDADEFIVPHQDPDLPSLLRRHEGADQVRIAEREFGFGGHRSPPEDLVIASYTTAHAAIPRYGGETPVRVKSIVRPDRVSAVRIHACRTLSGRTVDAAGRPVPEGSEAAPGPLLYAAAQVNHYYTRSFEEFERKRQRGSATGRLTRPPVPFDLPGGVEDRSIERFIPATRAMLARLRTLDADPYRYGDGLALGIGRRDAFPAEAAICIANHLAGLPEPSPNPALRLPTLPDEKGVLARAGRALVPGELRASPHVRAQLERLRARVAWDLDASGPWRSRGRLPLVVPIGEGAGPRCQAALLGFETTAATTIRIAVNGPDGRRHVDVGVPDAGTWIAFVTVDARPSRVDRMALDANGMDEVTFTDVLLITHA